jgi:hypothetical protein
MAKIPSIMGDDVLPEVVRSKADYQTAVLGRVYRDIAPFDPEGILQFEWCNARGAIARFDRGAVELRVLDVQECPAADLAVTGVIVEVLRGLVEERWSTLEQQERLTADVLTRQFRACIREAEEAAIDESDYAAALGLKSAKPVTAHALWENLAERVGFSSEPLDLILDEGPVARRITRTLGDSPTRADLARVYGKLCDCLAENRLFNA